MRKEQVAGRVDQPPFAAMLGNAEEAGRLELWAGGPTAVLVE